MNTRTFLTISTKHLSRRLSDYTRETDKQHIPLPAVPYLTIRALNDALLDYIAANSPGEAKSLRIACDTAVEKMLTTLASVDLDSPRFTRHSNVIYLFPRD